MEGPGAPSHTNIRLFLFLFLFVLFLHILLAFVVYAKKNLKFVLSIIVENWKYTAGGVCV